MMAGARQIWSVVLRDIGFANISRSKLPIGRSLNLPWRQNLYLGIDLRACAFDQRYGTLPIHDGGYSNLRRCLTLRNSLRAQ